jgi:hypothetical protein
MTFSTSCRVRPPAPELAEDAVDDPVPQHLKCPQERRDHRQAEAGVAEKLADQRRRHAASPWYFA